MLSFLQLLITDPGFPVGRLRPLKSDKGATTTCLTKFSENFMNSNKKVSWGMYGAPLKSATVNALCQEGAGLWIHLFQWF